MMADLLLGFSVLAAPIATSHLLSVNAAVLLLALGGLLIAVEFNAPGTVLPGAGGVFCVLYSLFELEQHHLSPVATVLLLVALALLLLEAKFSARGLLALFGIGLLVFALNHLIATNDPRLQVSTGIAAGAGIGFGLIVALLATLGERARKQKILTGTAAVLGRTAITQTPLTPAGQVLIDGEIWRAELQTAGATLPSGQMVKIDAVNGLIFTVTPV